MVINLKDYKYAFPAFLLFLLTILGIAASIAFSRPAWGDEIHFWETIKYFSEGVSIEKLKHYNEMSGPAPFLLYAGWGYLFGYDLDTLRVLSLLVGSCFFIVFFHYLYELKKDGHLALGASLFLICNPYMVGLSVFVFTDMIPVLAVLVAFMALKKKRLLLFSLASMLAILSRQYFVFFLVGTVLYHMFHHYNKRDNFHLQVIAAVSCSLLPLVFFMILWRGASPVNQLNVLYLDQAFQFHLSYLHLYILQIFVYLFPFVMWLRNYFYSNYRLLAVCFPLSLSYFFFPVQPCVAAVKAGFTTVGYFHKFLHYIGLQNHTYWIFYVFFLISLPVFATLVMDLIKDIRLKTLKASTNTALVIVMFYLIMPLSYLSWEKYFIPLVPFWIIYFIQIHCNLSKKEELAKRK